MVLAAGDGCECKVGDRVLTGKLPGAVVEVGDSTYKLVDEVQDVLLRGCDEKG